MSEIHLSDTAVTCMAVFATVALVLHYHRPISLAFGPFKVESPANSDTTSTSHAEEAQQSPAPARRTRGRPRGSPPSPASKASSSTS